MPHKSSIGFRWAGYWSKGILPDSKKAFIYLATWIGALSCWNIQLSPWYSSTNVICSLSSNSTYIWEFIRLRRKQMGSFALALKAVCKFAKGAADPSNTYDDHVGHLNWIFSHHYSLFPRFSIFQKRTGVSFYDDLTSKV